MPEYKVTHYNDESNMIHSENTVYAADADAAKAEAETMVDKSSGFGEYAETPGATMSRPRYRIAIVEVDD